MPGTKITDEDRQRIDTKFICTLCRLLLYIPYQTMCGHLMCKSCIENLLKYDNFWCVLLINIISLRFWKLHAGDFEDLIVNIENIKIMWSISLPHDIQIFHPGIQR